MPPAILDAYAMAVPALTAEESLQVAERVAVGSGSLKRGVGRRISEGWMRTVGRDRPQLRPTTKAEHQAYSQAAGVAVRYVRVERQDG